MLSSRHSRLPMADIIIKLVFFVRLTRVVQPTISKPNIDLPKPLLVLNSAACFLIDGGQRRLLTVERCEQSRSGALRTQWTIYCIHWEAIRERWGIFYRAIGSLGDAKENPVPWQGPFSSQFWLNNTEAGKHIWMSSVCSKIDIRAYGANCKDCSSGLISR